MGREREGIANGAKRFSVERRLKAAREGERESEWMSVDPKEGKNSHRKQKPKRIEDFG